MKEPSPGKQKRVERVELLDSAGSLRPVMSMTWILLILILHLFKWWELISGLENYPKQIPSSNSRPAVYTQPYIPVTWQ